MADALVRDGKWGIDQLRPLRRLSGMTFGLVGYGRIARQLSLSIRALGGNLLVHDPYLRPTDGLPTLVSLDELVERSDVISIHAPATPETRGMFDAARISRMRRGALLINTSRGPLVVLAEGKKEPKMPPKKAMRHPSPEEVRVLRSWVAAGAK